MERLNLPIGGRKCYCRACGNYFTAEEGFSAHRVDGACNFKFVEQGPDGVWLRRRKTPRAPRDFSASHWRAGAGAKIDG
jgi:hypothetical protein